jgi:anti-anti-sigma factor
MLDEMDHDAVGMVVDLSEVRHIDSTGIRMLHTLAGQLAQRRLDMRVVVPEVSSVRRVLELSCFDAEFPMTYTVDSAISEITCTRGEFSTSDLLAD